MSSSKDINDRNVSVFQRAPTQKTVFAVLVMDHITLLNITVSY
jgi:hypothetical protein